MSMRACEMYISFTNSCKPNLTRLSHVRVCVRRSRTRQIERLVVPSDSPAREKPNVFSVGMPVVHTVNFIGTTVISMLRGVRPPSCVLGSGPNSTLKLLSCVVSSPFPFALFFLDQREREIEKGEKRWPMVCPPKRDIAARQCKSSWYIALYPLQIAPRFSEGNVCRKEFGGKYIILF